MELQGFADGAGAGFTDEEIGKGHVVFDVLGEAYDGDGLAGRELLKFGGQLLVVAADEDELDSAR